MDFESTQFKSDYLRNEQRRRYQVTHRFSELSLVDLLESFLLYNYEFLENLSRKLKISPIQPSDDPSQELYFVNFINNLYLCGSAYNNIEFRFNSSLEILLRTVYENVLRSLYFLHIWGDENKYKEIIKTNFEYQKNTSLDNEVLKEQWQNWSNRFKFSSIIDQLYVNKEQTGNTGFDKHLMSKITYSLLSKKTHGNVQGIQLQLQPLSIATNNDLEVKMMLLYNFIFWNLGVALIHLDRLNALPVYNFSQINLIRSIDLISNYRPKILAEQCKEIDETEFSEIEFSEIATKGSNILRKKYSALIKKMETKAIVSVSGNEPLKIIRSISTFAIHNRPPVINCNEINGKHIFILLKIHVEMFQIDLIPDKLKIPEIEKHKIPENDQNFVEFMLRKGI